MAVLTLLGIVVAVLSGRIPLIAPAPVGAPAEQTFVWPGGDPGTVRVEASGAAGAQFLAPDTDTDTSTEPRLFARSPMVPRAVQRPERCNHKLPAMHTSAAVTPAALSATAPDGYTAQEERFAGHIDSLEPFTPRDEANSPRDGPMRSDPNPVGGTLKQS